LKPSAAKKRSLATTVALFGLLVEHLRQTDLGFFRMGFLSRADGDFSSKKTRQLWPGRSMEKILIATGKLVVAALLSGMAGHRL